VSDYVPQLTNLIVLDNVMKDDPSFVPAKEIIRIKHLLNFTSGMYYPIKDVMMHPEKQLTQYNAPHNKDDPIGEFFNLVKVNRFALLPAVSWDDQNKCRDPCLVFHSSTNRALIVG